MFKFTIIGILATIFFVAYLITESIRRKQEGFINLFSLNLIMQYIPTTNKHTQEQLQQEFQPLNNLMTG